MNHNFDNFTRQLAEYNLCLDGRQLAQFGDYYEMLVEKNRVMNLTTITEWEDVVEKHFVDSLAIVQVLADLHRELQVVDVGSGAGFPGIPLKLVFPELQVTLSDSLNKRVKFLEEVIDVLELKNISAVHSRAEELSKGPAYREQFDLAVSRAVANLSTLSEYCLPFVREGGVFVAYKSGDCDAEVAAAEPAIQILGGRLRTVKKFSLGEAARSFVVIDKVKPTPKKYPRRAGTPAKEPL